MSRRVSARGVALTCRMLALSAILACLGSLDVGAQPPADDSIAIIPPYRWPVAPASARPRDSLRALPREYWASALARGETRVIDGIVSAREPNRATQRLLIAGIAEEAQPTIALAPVSGDTGVVRRNVVVQTKAYLDWTARHFGRQLPSRQRARLSAMYRASADTAARIAQQRVASAADADRVRKQLARLMGRTLLRERDMYAPYPQAQRERFGRLRARSNQPLDTARYYKALESWMAHDVDSAMINAPRTTVPTDSRRALLFRAPTAMLTPAMHLLCGGGDTVVVTRQVDDWHALPVFEARVYEMSHQAIDWITDIMEVAGVDTEWFYHAGIGAGMFQMFKTHYVKTTRVGTKCDSLLRTPGISMFQQGGTVIRVDTTTVYAMLLVRWEIANGSAGDYRNTDDKRLVARVQFDTWDAAYKWLYTPTPTAGEGKYYPIRAVAYSVGDYGVNWTCQTSSNAFTYRRWGFIAIPEPSGAWLYGVFGNRGISERLDMWGSVRYGCVPGDNCFYNLTPPYATNGPMDVFYEGVGWGLDTFWNPRQNAWAYTRASYKPVTPPWGSITDRVREEPGWQ